MSKPPKPGLDSFEVAHCNEFLGQLIEPNINYEWRQNPSRERVYKICFSKNSQDSPLKKPQTTRWEKLFAKGF